MTMSPRAEPASGLEGSGPTDVSALRRKWDPSSPGLFQSRFQNVSAVSNRALSQVVRTKDSQRVC